jgi:hypothetical protein
MITYEASDFREIRTMSPLFFMFAIIVIYNKEALLTIALLVFVITSFPSEYSSASSIISEHKLASASYKNKVSLAMPSRQLAALTSLLDTKTNPIILFGYKPDDYTLDRLLLPVRTPSGKPIRYAINEYDTNLKQQAYDYVIFRSDSAPDLSSLHPTLMLSFFDLYKPIAASNK